MLRFESDRQAHFDVVVTHDAEDLMHPEALGWVNYHIQKYDMVQIPVLPLPTPAGELLHGVYCDEFGRIPEQGAAGAPAPRRLPAFLRNRGRLSRSALDRLAAAHSGRIFERNA